jgi:hypothetical protein
MKETGKVHSLEQVPSILKNDEELQDPKNMTNAFSNFFITFTENLNIHHVRKIQWYKIWTSWEAGYLSAPASPLIKMHSI